MPAGFRSVLERARLKPGDRFRRHNGEVLTVWYVPSLECMRVPALDAELGPCPCWTCQAREPEVGVCWTRVVDGVGHAVVKYVLVTELLKLERLSPVNLTV